MAQPTLSRRRRRSHMAMCCWRTKDSSCARPVTIPAAAAAASSHERFERSDEVNDRPERADLYVPGLVDFDVMSVGEVAGAGDCQTVACRPWLFDTRVRLRVSVTGGLYVTPK